MLNREIAGRTLGETREGLGTWPKAHPHSASALNANKRLYFIVLLKRARVPLNDNVNFYCTTIRPVLEYCAKVFHHAFPAYLNEDIERIQKRALSIISPAMSYRECLDSLGLPTLYDRRNGLCRQLFDSITINPGHKLYHLLPPRKQSSYNLRRQKLYNLPRSHTERFRHSFVYAMSQGCA